jgi:nitrite reductase/ring-hydroxylating ferredoxin subunit/uncharacterized membrane protein
MTTGVVQEIVDRQEWLDGLASAIQPLVRNAFSTGGEAGHMVKDLLNGVWLGHPVHPMITDVPVGAWTITELLDFLSAARGDDPGLDAAADISLAAGILAALGAAVTGITDWSDVDMAGTQQRMGLSLGLINVLGLTLDLGSLALRAGGRGRNRGAARALSAAGYMVAATAAYLGGDLVFSLGQAVNRNAWVSGPKKYTGLASTDQLSEGKMVKVDYKGRPIVLLKHDDGIHAFEGTCSHMGCGLWSGKLEGHIVTCPCHGSQFDVTDGSLVHGPATAPVPSYEVREHDGRIEIRTRNA